MYYILSLSLYINTLVTTSCWMWIFIFEFNFKLSEVKSIDFNVPTSSWMKWLRRLVALMNKEGVIEDSKFITSYMKFTKLTDSIETILTKAFIQYRNRVIRDEERLPWVFLHIPMEKERKNSKNSKLKVYSHHISTTQVLFARVNAQIIFITSRQINHNKQLTIVNGIWKFDTYP